MHEPVLCGECGYLHGGDSDHAKRIIRQRFIDEAAMRIAAALAGDAEYGPTPYASKLAEEAYNLAEFLWTERQRRLAMERDGDLARLDNGSCVGCGKLQEASDE